MLVQVGYEIKVSENLADEDKNEPEGHSMEILVAIHCEILKQLMVFDTLF